VNKKPVDFDPHAVAIRPAATVMIVADRPDLQVLLIERNANMTFAGGMWVFPGGAVDPGEADDFEVHCDGLDDAVASDMLGLQHGGLAYWVAALRENLEEAGLLLGRSASGEPLDAQALALDRGALNNRELSFLDLVRKHGLVLDTSAVHYVAHWVTPLGSPRRFSARFFVSSPPPDQAVQHDESETVGWTWMSPNDALARYEAGDMVMMTPTVRMLRSLALFDSADAVLAAASAGLADEQCRVRYEPDGSYTVVLPGDAGYEEGDPTVETGFVRLRPVA
jgi:8-oxo-dGTP pyrophosphatase MutT (NUDIX family)